VGTQAEGDANSCICRVNISEVNEAYLYGMLDYTVDSRGDVGAWLVYILIYYLYSGCEKLVWKGWSHSPSQ